MGNLADLAPDDVFTEESISVITAEALAIFQDNIQKDITTGIINIEDPFNFFKNGCDIGIKMIDVVCVVESRELELSFNKFSKQVITPSIIAITKKINDMPDSEYAMFGGELFNSKDIAGPIIAHMHDSGMGIQGTYGYSIENKRNVLGFTVMLVPKNI